MLYQRLIAMLVGLKRVLWSLWWLVRNSRQRRRFTGIVHHASFMTPAPEMAAGKLVLNGPANKPKWLRFNCPCGCGTVIALNLMNSHHPHWTITIHQDGTLSTHPSVDVTQCQSHFWIQHNRILWVRDRPRHPLRAGTVSR